jgi:peptidyl-prolyl cis-trans isomerase NIMA-interacting 4
MAGAKKGKTAAKTDSAQNAGGKGKGKGTQDTAQAGKAAPAKNKTPQSIEVSHILCDKFSQREEAYEKIITGQLSWANACKAYSTDKPRTGQQTYL